MAWYVVCGKELDWSLWAGLDEGRSALIGCNAQETTEDLLRNYEGNGIYRTKEAAEAELKHSMDLDRQQGCNDGYTQVKEITVEEMLQALCRLNRLMVDSEGDFASAPKKASHPEKNLASALKKLSPAAQQTSAKYMALYRDTCLSPAFLAMYSVGTLFRELAFCDATYKFGGFAAPHRYLIISAKAVCLDNIPPKTDWGLCVLQHGSIFKVIGKHQKGEHSQVTLLEIPEELRSEFTTASLSGQEEAFAAQAAERFEKALSLPALPENHTRQWLDRLTFPLGINEEKGQFFESWTYATPSPKPEIDTIGWKSDWFRRLVAYSVECRKQLPVVEREKLSPADEFRCQQIGGTLIQWLEKAGPHFLWERKMMCEKFMMKLPPEPAIVFTSTMPGLVAAAEILEGPQERIAYLLEDEYAKWVSESPDRKYLWHVHVWSFFRDPPEAEFEQEARQKYPIESGSVYWQHSEGTMWGEMAGRGGDHLWKWDGRKPVLLEEAISTWIS